MRRRDTLEYHIGSDTRPTLRPLAFVFRIALPQPEKVLADNVPPLPRQHDRHSLQ